MPTVSNLDVLGPMPWGGVGNARHFGGRDRDRSDARGGINSLLFEEPGRRTCRVPDEHTYASAQNFVSQSGYYGYQQTTPQAGEAQDGQDYSMDTSENNLPDHAFGVHPNAGFGAPVPVPASHVWHADQINMNQMQTRKRNLDARGSSGPVGADLLERPSVKRTKSSPFDEGVADISGGVVESEKFGGKMQLRLLENCELTALENLLKHTHGCDFYNYDGCDL